jgi:hypothetical protein
MCFLFVIYDAYRMCVCVSVCVHAALHGYHHQQLDYEAVLSFCECLEYDTSLFA